MTCEHCGREIVLRRRGSKYCSDTCKQKAYYKRKEAREAEAREYVVEKTLVCRRRGELDFIDALDAVTAVWNRAGDLYAQAAA